MDLQTHRKISDVIPASFIVELTARLRDIGYPNTTWHRADSGFIFMSGAPGHTVIWELKKIEQPEMFAEVKSEPFP